MPVSVDSDEKEFILASGISNCWISEVDEWGFPTDVTYVKSKAKRFTEDEARSACPTTYVVERLPVS